ncbi:MAG: hypothetical protein GX558_04645 [Clostridiales bacterium]|nr:hypothetical protein [Clostridiales bacterium]
MRTRLVRVRRRRPMGVVLATAMLVVALLGYLSLQNPVLRSMDARRTEAPGAPRPTALAASSSAERLTEDVRLGDVALYAVQLGAYDGADQAQVEAARYVRRGAAGYVHIDGTRRVLGAGYATRAEAETVVKRLSEDEGIAAAVYAATAESVLLRVTATRDQLDALTIAERTLREGAQALGSLAFSLDKGEVALGDAARQVQSLAAAALAARDGLIVQAGDDPNAVASGLIELLSAFDKNLSDSVSNGHTLMDFSSRMKYNYLDVRLKHIAFLRGLRG